MNQIQKQEYEKSLNETLQLFKEGHSMPKISYKRKLAFSTIEKHLCRLLEDKKIDIKDLLSQEKINLIENSLKDDAPLKEIKDKLPEDITYGEIKYVLASLGKLRKKKAPIESAINWYYGNFCTRKCFNHDEIIRDCMQKFEELKKQMGSAPIKWGEFKQMMDNDEIKICKLPLEKRKKIVYWGYFEHLKNKDQDFWDIE